MRMKTQDDFAAELAEMQQTLLQATGRDVAYTPRDVDAGIRCDFDLPYASLPSLEGRQWTNRGLI